MKTYSIEELSTLHKKSLHRDNPFVKALPEVCLVSIGHDECISTLSGIGYIVSVPANGNPFLHIPNNLGENLLNITAPTVLVYLRSYYLDYVRGGTYEQ